MHHDDIVPRMMPDTMARPMMGMRTSDRPVVRARMRTVLRPVHMPTIGALARGAGQIGRAHV